MFNAHRTPKQHTTKKVDSIAPLLRSFCLCRFTFCNSLAKSVRWPPHLPRCSCSSKSLSSIAQRAASASSLLPSRQFSHFLLPAANAVHVVLFQRTHPISPPVLRAHRLTMSAGCYTCQRQRPLHPYKIDMAYRVGVCQECYGCLEATRHRF
jgi:hypothetical protein